MTDECIDVSKCTITTTRKVNIQTSREMFAENISTQQEQREKTQEQSIKRTEQSNAKEMDNNNVSIASSADSGVGDVSGMLLIGDRPDAFGFGVGNGIRRRIEHTARMPTLRNATHYNMNHKKRGRALIFNHESFLILDLSKRKGTDKDCENLKETLILLGFDVTVHKDCKLKEIIQNVEKVSSEDHDDNDCLLIAILSHGEHGYIYACDVQYKLENISSYFTAQACPSLAGKPKLFFIQACRGDNFDAGIVLYKTETDGDSSSNYKIPVHADFLFMYSTIPGYYSWRSPDNGSWFIQALVKELRKNGKVHDLLTLLTFVNQRVAFDYESYVPGSPMMHSQKQIPCVTSMLTRILRFSDKKDTTD